MSNSTLSIKRRIKSTTVACPIIYGSAAIHLGKKAEEFSTHSWKLYIRGPNEEDLTSFIDKVAFTLHPSFAEPVRVVKAPPFEVSETGWGEFEASIRLYFKDPEEQPVDLFHLIKLYPANAPQQVSTIKKPTPVVAEQYDEIVFVDPTEFFYERLMRYTAHTSKLSKISDDSVAGAPAAFQQLVFDDSLDVERLTSIHHHITGEVEAAKVRLLHLQAQVVEAAQQRRLEQKLAISVAEGGGANKGAGGDAAGAEGATGSSIGRVATASGKASGGSGGSSSSTSRPSKGSQSAQGTSTAVPAAGGTGVGAGPAAKRPRPAPKKPTATAAPNTVTNTAAAVSVTAPGGTVGSGLQQMEIPLQIQLT